MPGLRPALTIALCAQPGLGAPALAQAARTPDLSDMYTRSALLFTLLVVLRIGAVAQSYQDSLLRVWNNTSLPDTSRLAAAQKLIWRMYLQRSPDTARYFAEEQL